MIKLTVMYNLPEGADHDAFLKWRTTEHQKENMGIPGVLKSDFYAVKEIYTHVPGPEEVLRAQPLAYRYITEAHWPDMETFKDAFFDCGYQEKLMESLKRITNPIFFISEEVLSEYK